MYTFYIFFFPDVFKKDSITGKHLMTITKLHNTQKDTRHLPVNYHISQYIGVVGNISKVCAHT